MMRAAASGWDIMTTCEDRISVTLLPARLAMKRWVAGGMTLSSVGIRYQDGMDFQAGAPLPPLRPSTAPGRWVAAIRRVLEAGRSGANAPMYTRAFTLACPRAALVMTTPP